MAKRTTTSSADAERLKLSPEVHAYLISRGIPLPDCPPKIKTPEPRGVRGAKFDPARVDRVLRAFGALRHTQGQWAGLPLKPDPWQVAYIIAPVFGWVHWNPECRSWVRIITDLYVDVPRKNGKSTLSGGIAIYLTCADGEAGAQVLAAATSERQAGFVFQPVKHLALKSPALKGHVQALAKKIYHPRSMSYFEVIANVADAQHGANVHGAIIDELHVHKTPDLVTTIETGRGSRTQPLIVIITTADDGRPNTIYDLRRRRTEQLANGTLKAPHIYGVVWAADEDDDPFSEETLRKANPGYGISPTASYLRARADEARQSPAELASYLRLHLGIRTKQDARYIGLAEWDRCAGLVDEAKLRGRIAYGGLDLGNVADITAVCWLFPDKLGYDALWRFWLPEDRVRDLDKRTAGAMSQWIKEGFVHVTPGSTTDYDFVIAKMDKDRRAFRVREIGYDPWNANQLTKRLAEQRAPLVEVRQGFKTLSPPMKEIKRLLAAGTEDEPLLRSGVNPVMRWMTDNLTVAIDPSGNVKPDKSRAAEKIDGWSALATAMSRAMHHRVRRSAYAASETAG